MLDVHATEATASPGGSPAGPRTLRASADDDVVELINPAGAGEFVLVCEHASHFIPAEFADLGLPEEALTSHIAWDPGALEVARRLSEVLDAPLVAQRVSRLVYDCNRPPEAESAIPETSEIYRVPGNVGLQPDERNRRAERYYRPFRRALAGCLDSRIAAGRRPALVTVHSFTPVYFGARRDTEIGILHDADRRLADHLIARAAEHWPWCVGRNEPYGPADGVTHTLVAHALPRGLANVMIEIRNDLVADAAGQDDIARPLAAVLRDALDALQLQARNAAPAGSAP